MKPNDSRLTAQPGYQFNVMLNKSGVHLPVEVYRGDPSVFHTLRWTEVLDAIFPTEPKLHFTYFASLTGILRVYPGFLNVDPSSVPSILLTGETSRNLMTLFDQCKLQAPVDTNDMRPHH
ncbi:unnamed protein product [Trichobilharzia regenti]|nr:unnamed protein product [Trichobilharzia regenti]